MQEIKNIENEIQTIKEEYELKEKTLEEKKQ